MKHLPVLLQWDETAKERYELVMARIRELALEYNAEDYRGEVARKLLQIADVFSAAQEGKLLQATCEELRRQNEELYAPKTVEGYRTSFLNPDVAVQAYGQAAGAVLSAVYSEVFAWIPAVFRGEGRGFLYVCELFAEICGHFADKSFARNIKQSLFYYAHDYCGEFADARMYETRCPEAGAYYHRLLMEEPLEECMLYRYGVPITENERGIFEYLNGIDESIIETMAKTYVDGYVNGFQVMGLSFEKKRNVEVRTAIGFERVTRRAISMLEEMGKRPLLYLRSQTLQSRTYGRTVGMSVTSPNMQCEYDHRYDALLYMNRRYLDVYLRMIRAAYRNVAEECLVYAGPACQETFGEPEFQPKNKSSVLIPTERQRGLLSEKRSKSSAIAAEYIPLDETSFTIIAYPLPSIGANFREVFADTVSVNGLNNEKYKAIQKHLIDVLDKGTYVTIKGAGENETALRIALHTLEDPEKQTNFENCTADVNIPVGEVFTSPVLEGTCGLLHVGKVYLEGNLFLNLRVRFEDGRITEYSCENFSSEEENRNYIRENILANHESLPMGEFAIGTNTTAYAMGIRHGIQKQLPILIAEKTGPHFAVGDTCYSHSEEHAVYNSDGKEIIARDNEVSLQRHVDKEKAYFNCHTDITIPYNEVDSIMVHGSDGEVWPIIEGGRFVVPGTEELNVPLEELK